MIWDWPSPPISLKRELWVEKNDFILLHNIFQQLSSYSDVEEAAEYFKSRTQDGRFDFVILKYFHKKWLLPEYVKEHWVKFFNQHIAARLIKCELVYTILNLKDLCELLSLSYFAIASHPDIKKALNYVKIKDPNAFMISGDESKVASIEFYGAMNLSLSIGYQMDENNRKLLFMSGLLS